MWWNSSKDAKKLSLTVRGFFTVGIISVIVIVLGFAGVDIDATDIESLLDSIQGVIIGIGSLGGAVMILYGGLRKIFNKIKK